MHLLTGRTRISHFTKIWQVYSLVLTKCSNFSQTFINAEHFIWQDSHVWEFSVLLETANSFSYSPSHHKVSHGTNKCLYCDYANGGTGSDIDASWIRSIEQMNDLVKRKLNHLISQAQCSMCTTRGYQVRDINNPPKELMYHEGQRSSEAMCNGIKYITCSDLSPFLCHEGSGLLRQLSSGQPITLFPIEVQVKACILFSSRTEVLFYMGWENVSYTQMRFLHASAYSPRYCPCCAPCLSVMPGCSA